MITEERKAGQRLLRIESLIELTAASEARERLSKAIAMDELPIRLDFTDQVPTAPALQLLLAARRTLVAAGRFDGWGQAAALHLDTHEMAGTSPTFASVRSAA